MILAGASSCVVREGGGIQLDIINRNGYGDSTFLSFCVALLGYLLPKGLQTEFHVHTL